MMDSVFRETWSKELLLKTLEEYLQQIRSGISFFKHLSCTSDIRWHESVDFKNLSSIKEQVPKP